MVRVVTFSALLLGASVVSAQPPADPSGHWGGTITLPNTQIALEMDLAPSSDGRLRGTLTNRAEKLLGLPLSVVDVDGASVSFQARTDQRFRGMLSSDGATIQGDYLVQGFAFPFTFTRDGTAHLEAEPSSPGITSDLAGTWNGTVSPNGGQMHIVLTLTNRADGTSSGYVTNLDEGSLTLPIAAIAQDGTSVTLRFTVLDATYVGLLDRSLGEIAGTWTQSGTTLPIVFQRQRR